MSSGITIGRSVFPYAVVMSAEDSSIVSNYLDEKSINHTRISLLKVYEDLYNSVFINTMLDSSNYPYIKDLMNYYYPDKYNFSENDVVFSDDSSKSEELVAILKRNGTPMTLDSIQGEAQTLTASEISDLLLRHSTELGIIKVDIKTYSHIDYFHLNDQFYEITDKVVSNSLTNSDMADIDYIYSETNARFGSSDHLSLYYDINSPFCLANILVYHNAELSYANGFIYKQNQSKRLVDQINAEFLKYDTIDNVLFDHIMRKYKRQQWSYLENILDNFVRVNKDTFVRKEMIVFDVPAIDQCLSHFLTKGYCAITSITSYALFPNVGFPWNHYLLFSFVYSFSDTYTMITPKQGITRDFHGIIVFKDTFSSLDEVCARCLHDAGFTNDQLNNETLVGEYLKKMGFISRVRGSFGSIISMAKALGVEEDV